MKQTLKTEIDNAISSVLCDAEKINQVLMNLIGNAHKFTQEGGEIYVRAAPRDTHVVIEVEDNGPGIPVEDQHKIFDKFTQINRIAGPGTKGTGLGLAISKKIVDLHEGEIYVESAKDQGSKFVFTLPFYNEIRELKAFIRDRIFERQGKEKSWSLVILKMGDDSNDAANDLKILNQLKSLTQKNTRKDEDGVLLMENGGKLVILIHADEKHARSILEKITGEWSRTSSDRSDLCYALVPLSHESYDNSIIDFDTLSYKTMKLCNNRIPCS
jgi:hypothetical protein